VPKQEAGKVRLNLFQQGVDLVMELIYGESVDPRAPSEPETLKVYKVDIISIECKLQRCLKKHVLALSEAVYHC
jgi:hypothetical protein